MYVDKYVFHTGLLDSSSVTCLHDVADPSQSRLHSEISSNGSYETLPHTNKSSPAKNENIHGVLDSHCT